jgi:hypothetical protein
MDDLGFLVKGRKALFCIGKEVIISGEKRTFT